jgi:cytochrome c nitrite reductase small subunit
MTKIAFVLAMLAVLVVAGIGLYVTDFTAYLGNDPTTCNNCHVMDAAYEGWYHAPHKNWTTCNDCHTPHDLIPKYITKAENGYHHVTAFLFKTYPVAIRAREVSRDIVQENCVRCHQNTVADVSIGQHDSDRRCFECHRTVAHGERGISILPIKSSEEYAK